MDTCTTKSLFRVKESGERRCAKFASAASDLRGVQLFLFSFSLMRTKWLHFLWFAFASFGGSVCFFFGSEILEGVKILELKKCCGAGNWEEPPLEAGWESSKHHVVKGVMEPDSLLGG